METFTVRAPSDSNHDTASRVSIGTTGRDPVSYTARVLTTT